ncbi:MAG: hypothetical protein HDR79_08470 [Bacteroides sp.]|nr:hypothetical protein [Bacteroides sp.]MBD5343356.1 hypothetical protein [Bacteroides sp.]MBD5359986.1 hypothetical protein [Bacteroides sp.]MBD5364962.1 hypothetical protein [Bacteroides sp.]
MSLRIRQRNLINKLVFHALDSPYALGLFHGQMGILIVVAHCSKQWGLSELECVADFLFEHIRLNTRRVDKIGLSTGLSGICWGVEYLVQHGIMPGPADDICEEVDGKIMQTDVRRIDDFSLATGLNGLWLYVKARIQGNLVAGLPLPFDFVYLNDWQNVLTQNKEHFPVDAAQWLMDARKGRITPYELRLPPFIRPMRCCPQTDLSLSEGLAGYIAFHYLHEI